MAKATRCDEDGRMHRWALLCLGVVLQESTTGEDIPVSMEADVRCLCCRDERRGLSIKRLREMVVAGDVGETSLAQWASLRSLCELIMSEEREAS